MPKKKPAPKPHGGARPGSGRPRIYEHLAQPTSIVLELAQLVRLDYLAERIGISRSAAIKRAVSDWIEKEQ